MSVLPIAVVAAARGLVGTPYHHQGRQPGVGIDCAGVPIVIARALQIIDPHFDVNGYSRHPDGSLQPTCDEFMDRSAEPEVGGVVLVTFGAAFPSHLGVVGQWSADPSRLSMIHADRVRSKAVIETRLHFGRAMRLVQAYRLRGVAY